MSKVESYSSEWNWLFSSFKKNTQENLDGGNKRSRNVAIVLSLFLGWTGLDRYYLGKIGTGILKMITFGGFGIWWLIDLFLMVGGKNPKDVTGMELKESADKYSFTYLSLTVFGSMLGLHYFYLGFKRLAFTRLGLFVLYILCLYGATPSVDIYGYSEPSGVMVALTAIIALVSLLWTCVDLYLAITGKIASDAEGTPLVSGEPRYQSVCLLFSLVGGFWGFDRFYLGHRVLGLLKLFTLGGFFMWYGLDIILSILNVHKDSKGQPLVQE